MTLGDAIGLSLRNLSQSKLRTALTTLGVSIGIASLAGMVSLGVGLQDQILGRFMQSGVFGTITVTTMADLPGPLAQLGNRRGAFGGRGGQKGGNVPNSATPSTAAKLDDAALKQIAALENVGEVYPSLRLPLDVSFGEFSRGAAATGVPMSSKSEGAFQTIPYGRFFTSDTENACMLTLDLAKRINENPGSLIGQSLKLSYAAHSVATASEPAVGVQVRQVDLQCPIVGIVERDLGPLPPGGGALVPISGLMMPLGMAKTIDSEIVTSAQSLLHESSEAKSYSVVTVKVKQAQYTQDVEDRIRRLGYNAFSVDDALRGAKTAFILLDIFLSLIGSIALAVSSLGIVNTMVMSILERTREIGIMKSIGAGNNDIRLIFLLEASVIGLLGGLVGIALGWTVGRLINFGANIYIQSQGGTPGTLFSLPLWLVAGAIAFSIAISLAAGSYPASRAAALDPIQALRHD